MNVRSVTSRNNEKHQNNGVDTKTKAKTVKIHTVNSKSVGNAHK